MKPILIGFGIFLVVVFNIAFVSYYSHKQHDQYHRWIMGEDAKGLIIMGKKFAWFTDGEMYVDGELVTTNPSLQHEIFKQLREAQEAAKAQVPKIDPPSKSSTK